jgi:hypothetical protein
MPLFYTSCGERVVLDHTLFRPAMEVSRRDFLGTTATALLLGADILPAHCEWAKEAAPLPEGGVKPLAHRPPPAVFSTPFGDKVPDDTDDYLILNDTISGLGSLNGLPEKPLIDGEISGKRVVIQAGSSRLLKKSIYETFSL